MNLSKKVPLSFALAMILTLAAGLGGLWIVGSVMSVFKDEVMQHVAEERAAADLESHFKTQVQEWKNVLLRGTDEALLKKHWQAFQTEEKAVDEGATRLRASTRDTALQAQLDAFLAAHRKMATGYRAGLEKYQAAGLEPSVGDVAVRGIDREPAKLLRALGDDIAKRSADVAASTFARGRQASLIGSGLMLLGAALGLGVGVALSRSVVRPLQHATDLVREVAQGNLTRPIQGHDLDETGRLLGAMSDMQQQLTRLVGAVRSNADSVATASAQIAQGNGDLAGRTEQQSSALQEAASSMTELGHTVRQTADNAQHASGLAEGASQVAARGGEVVSQVVDTMKGIQDASRRIGDIIGVIDGIAFQTNILALNAAVEAARAGEQGRGFAVVAGEVRSLAQRSAEAAREIKGLIQASTERVDQGTALADQAGSTMGEVVQAINQVNQLIRDISQASLDQSGGVSQMGDAVARMDQGTQQNAALVEETSAAAESLRQQAAQLVAAVGAFRTTA
jgi:methyl-accepting chemotaxis protein